MRYWWVNQNQTYRAEVRGSFMWSPKQNANGARNQFYENMREVSPGDVVFSFCDTRIKALGVVTGGAQTGPKPDFGAAGSNWSREGWCSSTRSSSRRPSSIGQRHALFVARSSRTVDECHFDIGQRDHHGHRIDRRGRESSLLVEALRIVGDSVEQNGPDAGD